MIKFTKYFLSYVSGQNYPSKSIRTTYLQVILCLLSPLQWTSSFKYVTGGTKSHFSVTYYTQLIPISFSGILYFTGPCKTVHKKLICVPGMYVLLIIRFKMTKNLNGTDFLQLSQLIPSAWWMALAPCTPCAVGPTGQFSGACEQSHQLPTKAYSRTPSVISGSSSD